ncbi:GTPase IMAP family member 3-like protein [Cricetulus griseus]|nr:GTPase IMAP family member 3-like protein [Cricetulus griseus]
MPLRTPVFPCRIQEYPQEDKSFRVTSENGAALTHLESECLRPACNQLETHQNIKANCTHLKRTPDPYTPGKKTNMTPPEPRDSTPSRHEHPNTEEAEESNLKNNFMEMIENLREEIRKSFREMEEKTTQKMQEIKDSQKSQENTIKQLKETVQDLKTELETKKKTQTEGMLEVEKLSKQSGTTDASITNRIQEKEDRISDAEDKLEEINSSSKENLKSNKSITQNNQEIWDTMKRPNLRIIGIEECEETQLEGAENIFNKIIEENFHNLKKDMTMKVKEAK